MLDEGTVEIKLTIDFETRSRAPLKKIGAWVYSEDPSTDYICLAVKVDNAAPRLHYGPRFEKILRDAGRLVEPSPFSALAPRHHVGKEEVWELIARADEIEAHNAPFEIAIWHNVCFLRHGWPDLPLEKMRDSAAKCRMAGLPASLEGAGEALGLPVQKDREGHLLMMKMCKPRKPSKGNPNEWIEDADSLVRLGGYCLCDVDAEHCLSSSLPDLSEAEQAVWLWDQRVNLRGIPVDRLFAERAIEMLASAEEALLAEFRNLTGGKVMSPRQVSAMLSLLEDHECEMEKLDKKSVARMLKKEGLDPTAERMLQIRAALGKSSTAKFGALLAFSDRHHLIRQSLIYHGAGTGRWTAKGFQPHNLPKGDYSDTDWCVDMILDRDWRGVAEWYGGVQAAAATCIRAAIKAPVGREFIAADLSAIEPRVTAWLAGAKHILDTYRAGLDHYKATYSRMFGVPYEQVTKAQRNKAGKPSVLLFGFGGGKDALHRGTDGELKMKCPRCLEPLVLVKDRRDQAFCAGCLAQFEDTKAVACEDLLAVELVDRWRESNPEIVAAWKELFSSAKKALAYPGEAVWCLGRKIAFCKLGRLLLMRLPSGRKLYYCDPHFADRGKGWEELCFRGVDPISKKWSVQNLYGGKLMENAVQAASRDILVHNMMRLDAGGYPIVFHVHDEAVAMVELGQGDVKEFENELSRPPPWARDIPLAAEGWRGERYRK